MTSAACMPPTAPLGYKVPLYGRAGVVGFATIDSEDMPRVSAYRWNVAGGYAVYSRRAPQRVRILMHRLVMGVTGTTTPYVDHISGDKLDNRKANLRLVDPRAHTQNVSQWGSKSRFRGVHRTKNGTWAAVVQVGGISHRVGTYATEEDAGLAAAIFRAKHLPLSRDALDETLHRLTPPERLARPESASGALGVYASGGKFVARLTVAQRRVYLGVFTTRDEAVQAVEAAKARIAAGLVPDGRRPRRRKKEDSHS